MAGIQSISGYPQAARVIQAPQTLSGGAIQSQATIRSGTVIQSQARTVGTTSPTLTQATRPATYTTQSVGTAGVRQAKIITSGAISSGVVQPNIISSGGIRTVSGATLASAPRIIQSQRAATVISSTAKPNTIAGPSYTQGAYETKHADDPQLQNLKELRKSCGLVNVPVNDALQTFKTGAVDGKLTRADFQVVYAKLLDQFQVEAVTDDVKNAVFDLFDRDDNGVVDMMELICGASLLCTGTEEDKIHAVFNVFDENGDGVISMDEMFKFLTSVFKVVLTPNVMAVMNTMGVTVESPEDLASVTALECFKTADLNHDGRLSVAEFKNWFFAPRNDPSFLFSPVRKLLQ
jgi:Ca2+-binding EF-hand superfamily protein